MGRYGHRPAHHAGPSVRDMHMKKLLLATSALLLITACNDKAADKSESSGGASAVTAPTGAKWTETTAVTPDGGMLMGNPNAPVKLIEYGALTCSHCAEFSEQSSVELKAMIDKGSVSYEFRTFLLNGLDIPAALLARCSGAVLPSYAPTERGHHAMSGARPRLAGALV